MAEMASRVVPTIDGSPTYLEISLRWIDAVGDVRSDVSIVDAGATDAQIEELVVRLVSGSRASLYAVRVTQVYSGEKSKDNADSGVRVSVQDNIVYHASSAGSEPRRGFFPSPKASMFVAGTEIPDPGAPILINWMAAWDALWAGTFSGVSLRFTERRDINKKVNL